MERHREAYREEAYELLAELESSLLSLEETPEDRHLIGRVFRAMHTIKGSGAMFGFDDIAAFTHEIETVFDRVRDGKIPATKPLIDLALTACDLIRKMVDNEPVDEDRISTVIAGFTGLLTETETLSEVSEEPETADETEGFVEYRIVFKPDLDIFENGTNPLLLIKELTELGDCRIFPDLSRLPPLVEFNPLACYLAWEIRLVTDAGKNAIRDVFIFTEDSAEIVIERLETLPEQPKESFHPWEPPPEIPEPPPEKPAEIQKTAETRKEDRVVQSVRVPAEKLDGLVDLVGELVTVQARLTRKATLREDAELFSIAEEVERLTAELRDDTMRIRMLPIGTTFNQFRRVVRDLAAELGKEVSLVTEGAETELDKTVIEQLNEPLIHIIRNTIDHEIETPAERRAQGKPLPATIRLSAEHSGSNVFIHIAGDGAGIDTEAIHRRAVEIGRISEDAQLTENELISLIFDSGFSTAKRVSEISGRGVGLDVVKRTVESLGGAVFIESKRGEGTVTTLKLPLTLAIIDGLQVNIGKENFIIPLSAVEECLELSGKELTAARNRRIIRYRGKTVSYLNLRTIFTIGGKPPENEQVVIVEAKEERVGLGIDHVVGQHQTVIKSIGRMYRDVDGISGATILGDGTVALIIDVPRLVSAVAAGEQTEAAGMKQSPSSSGRSFFRASG